MHFTHDTAAALVTASALVNTAKDGEALATPEALVAFLDEHAVTGRRDGTGDELAAVQALREELRRAWGAGEAEALVAQVNDLLVRTDARPQLVRHDGWDWHLHATAPDAPLAQRLGAEAALALADVVRGEDLHRLRSCASDGCRGVLVDLSRNSSRRFCDTGCANRTHVAALRARRRSEGQGRAGG